LTTPLGWARAHLIYEKEPRPKPGSLVEVVFLLVFFMRQRMKFQETRVLAQAAIDQKGEETLKAFESFRKTVFPYDRSAKMQEYAKQMDVLHRWVQGGALQLTPQQLPGRGKRADLARGAAALRARQAQKEMGLLRKM
jgi:hypothetical protein